MCSLEANAVLDLLEQLILKGRVVTADAAFCQQDVCQTKTTIEVAYGLTSFGSPAGDVSAKTPNVTLTTAKL